jgi:hypothetical protein
MACGPQALQGALNGGRFLRAFFFSVETFSMIGYGNIVPVGVLPNFLVVAESLSKIERVPLEVHPQLKPPERSDC